MSERGRMRVFDARTLAETAEASRSRVRRRANLNIHERLEDAIQRMFNVFQPESYVRPHRHEPERWELFTVLAGRACALTFDDSGAVADRALLEPGGTRAVEISGRTWHTLFALVPDTVLFEVKPGPFRPLEDKDFAPWAPREGTPAAGELLSHWQAGLG